MFGAWELQRSQDQTLSTIFSRFSSADLARTSDFDFGRSASARLVYSDPKLFAGPISSTGSTANRLGLASGATSVPCCGHLGRSGSATRRLGRASFTHAATAGMRGLRIESWCELHALGGCGHSMPTRRTSELAVGVLSWRSSRELGRSRVQWRARGYLGHQVVVLAHFEEGCALVGLCLSTFTSRQLHISPPPPVLSPGQQPLEATQLE